MTQSIHLVGRIGKEPVTREWQGKKVSNFSVATSDIFRDGNGEKQEETQWHKCVLWQNDKLIPFLAPGTLVYVKGQMKYGSFEKDVNGQMVTIPTSEVIAESVVLLSAAKHEPQEL